MNAPKETPKPGAPKPDKKKSPYAFLFEAARLTKEDIDFLNGLQEKEPITEPVSDKNLINN